MQLVQELKSFVHPLSFRFVQGAEDRIFTENYLVRTWGTENLYVSMKKLMHPH